MVSKAPPAFSIGDLEFGRGPCKIVAEVAQAHDGSLGAAHAYIDACAAAGAHAIKFQTHIAAAESTPSEPFRIKFSKQDANRYDYWKRMEFTKEQWAGLKQHADEKEIAFLSSAFSDEAVDLLIDIGVKAFKVGAGEISNLPMLERMAKAAPVILSSGMSTWAELDAAVECVLSAGAPVSTLQCTSSYPCPPEKLGLNVIAALDRRYGCPVGLSDHSGKIYPGIAAAALGASLVEVHVVFSRESFGPDVPVSLTTKELAQLVDGCTFIERALSHPVDKDAMAKELMPMRDLFMKSIVAASDLDAGHTLTEADLKLRKPGTGLAPRHLPELVGRRLARKVATYEMITEDVLE